jgi:hypothetical protein
VAQKSSQSCQIEQPALNVGLVMATSTVRVVPVSASAEVEFHRSECDSTGAHCEASSATMIDSPAQTDRLLSKPRSSLPMAAMITPELARTLRDELGGLDVPATCRLTRTDYAGDEGGIICKLEFGPGTGDRAFFVSITHLRFGARSPLTRDIVAYQKHRTKRLRRLSNIA